MKNKKLFKILSLAASILIFILVAMIAVSNNKLAGYFKSLIPLNAEEIASLKAEKLKAGQVFKARLEKNFVYIQGGSFQMGSNYSGSIKIPIHTVIIKPFAISKYEVTEKEWRNIMGDGPIEFDEETYGTWRRDSSKEFCADCPIEKVNLNDVHEYIEKLNIKTEKKFRLPTEAEWEYACRSGGKEQDYCGDGLASNLAWYSENSNGTHPVGQKQANGLGLYDMSGNVDEWIEGCWQDHYSENEDNESCSRVLRGSAWVNRLFDVRSGRTRTFAHAREHGFGFRLVQD